MFKTKTAELRFFKTMLADAEVGKRIFGEAAEKLEKLLLKHPAAKEKIGAGISHFTVETGWNCRCFHVHRVDGTNENFSYKKCVNGESSFSEKLNEACRHAIARDAEVTKQYYFDLYTKREGRVDLFCDIVGEDFDFKNCHLDHNAILFKDIVQNFAFFHSDMLNLESFKSATFGIVFKSPALESIFRVHHFNSVSKSGFDALRLISKQANLQMSDKATDRGETLYPVRLILANGPEYT